MQDAIHENLKRVITAFDHFIEMYETHSWINTSSPQTIGRAFEISTFVEDKVVNFKQNGCQNNFMEVLLIWWNMKSRTHVYDLDFFAVASDHLLSLFFKNSSVSSSTLDEAVKVYTQKFTQERFQGFLENALLESRTYSAIANLTESLGSRIDLEDLECKLLLNSWCLEVACARESYVEESILRMLSTDKIEQTLQVLLRILLLPESVGEKAQYVQKKLMLKHFVLQMSERSTLRKTFWLCLFSLRKCYVIGVCEKYSKFFNKLVSFIFYTGGMMKLDSKGGWVGDELSICPELTYETLTIFAKCLCIHKLDFRNYIESRIADAKTNNVYLFWSDFEKDVLK